MGNNPSQAIAAASMKSQLNGTMSDVNKTLGLGEDGKSKEADVPQYIGCANKKEQKQRQKERQLEYEEKQRERTERKEALSNKWVAASTGGAGGSGATSVDEKNDEKQKELDAKMAAIKSQYAASATAKEKNSKKKSGGLFGKKN